MEKLTSTDEHELIWWFAEPPPETVAHIAAQSYDPKGAGYSPWTDTTLARLVLGRRGDPNWERVKRILARVAQGTGGRAHVDVLRRAYGPSVAIEALAPRFRHSQVALCCPTALRRATDLATAEATHQLLVDTGLAARVRGCSAMTIATRVYEAYIDASNRIHVREEQVDAAAIRVLARAADEDHPDLAFLAEVSEEATALVDAAGTAYRAARKELGASRREAKETQRKANEAALDAALGRKRRKESERFAAKLARAS